MAGVFETVLSRSGGDRFGYSRSDRKIEVRESQRTRDKATKKRNILGDQRPPSTNVKPNASKEYSRSVPEPVGLTKTESDREMQKRAQKQERERRATASNSDTLRRMQRKTRLRVR